MSVLFDPEELRELEHRLTTRLDEIAPAVRPRVSDAVRSAIATTPQRRGLQAWVLGHRPEVALRPAVLGAFVVALAIATGIGIGTSGLLTQKSTASGPPAPQAIGETWRQVQLDPTNTRFVVEDGYASEAGFVLVGSSGYPPPGTAEVPAVGTSPVAWYSNDGLTWRRSEIANAPGEQMYSFQRVFAFAGRLYAMGPGSPQGVNVEFESTDGGASWATVATAVAPGGIRDVIAGGPGLVAAGNDGELLMIWTSADGRTWEGADLSAAYGRGLTGTGMLVDVALYGGQLFAVGATNGADPSGIALTSTDGIHWQSVTLPTNFTPASVAGGVGGWAIAGQFVRGPGDRGYGAAIIVSHDEGASWSVAIQGSGSDQIASVAASSAGFVAAGDSNGLPAAWTSTDGAAWSKHLLPSDPATTSRAGQFGFATPDMFLVTADPGAGPPLAWISPPNASPRQSVRATPTPTPTPTATSEPLPVSHDYSTWQSVEMPDPSPQVFGGEWPYAVAQFHGQLIAVGAINGGCCTGTYTTDSRAVVWRSIDAQNWELEPHRSAFALGRMQALATNGQILVAAGSVNLESKSTPGGVAPIGATWISTDGSTWTRHTGMPTFYSVVWFRDRFYAVGEDAAAGSSSVWSSADGMRWSLVRTFSGDFMTILRATPLGLAVAGSSANSQQDAAVTWFSSDGSSWTRYLAPGGSTLIYDMAGSPNVLVAVGGVVESVTNSSGAAFWVGYGEWTRGVTLYGDQVPQLQRVMWTGSQFLAFGEDATGIRAFTSADGVRWDEVPRSSAMSGSGRQVTAATVMSDGRVVAVGVGEGDPGHHGVPLAWVISP